MKCPGSNLILRLLYLIGCLYGPAISISFVRTSALTDFAHFSKIFNRDTYFRLYLTAGYNNTQEHLRVIHFIPV